MTNCSLMKFESIAKCSPWSILQYFWPALSDNWSWKSIFGLFFEWLFYTGFTVLFFCSWKLFYASMSNIADPDIVSHLGVHCLSKYLFNSFHYRKGSCYGKHSKISNSSCLPLKPGQTWQTQIKLPIKKQSDQGLPCLIFWQAFCDFPALITNILIENRKRKCFKF